MATGQYSGTARFDATGAVDASFSAASGNFTLARQPDGEILLGGRVRIYTDDAPAPAPVAWTAGTSPLAVNGMTLNACVNPNGQMTSVQFQYGPTVAYASSTSTLMLNPVTADVPVAVNLTNLLPGATYHYRVIATNASGTSNGWDGIFTVLAPAQDWRQTWFGTTNATGTAADTADPDGDGISNLLERALGLNPTATSADGLPTVRPDSATGRLVLTATRGGFDASDLTFSAEASSDLVNWTTAGVTVLTNTATSFQARDDGPNSPSRFLRLRVTQSGTGGRPAAGGPDNRAIEAQRKN